MSGIRLIVGLGNSGAEYEDNRHNAGFWFLDSIVCEYGAGLRRQSKLHGAFVRVSIAGHNVGLFKPATFMNQSARAVQAVAAFYRVEMRQVLVAHDEIDFPVARIRLKFGGGHGGHNGLRDITTLLGRDFWRLRIGIGHPGDRRRVVSYVLGDAGTSERAAISESCKPALALIPQLVRGEFDAAINSLHSQG